MSYQGSMLGMSRDRYNAIMGGVRTARLDDNERAAGWHFSWEWDGMLINPSWPEAEACACDICKNSPIWVSTSPEYLKEQEERYKLPPEEG